MEVMRRRLQELEDRAFVRQAEREEERDEWVEDLLAVKAASLNPRCELAPGVPLHPRQREVEPDQPRDEAKVDEKGTDDLSSSSSSSKKKKKKKKKKKAKKKAKAEAKRQKKEMKQRVKAGGGLQREPRAPPRDIHTVPQLQARYRH